MGTIDEDWPRDVILDLIMYLTRSKYHQTAEQLADALMVFETERSARRIAAGALPEGAPAHLKVIDGKAPR